LEKNQLQKAFTYPQGSEWSGKIYRGGMKKLREGMKYFKSSWGGTLSGRGMRHIPK
jgi:hypothetical protein